MLMPRETHEEEEEEVGWQDWSRDGGSPSSPDLLCFGRHWRARPQLAPRDLADYVQGWYLFMDAGLDPPSSEELQHEGSGRGTEEALV